MRYSQRAAIAVLFRALILPMAGGACFGEDFSVQPLTADELQAVDSIQQGSVTATVGFLASDEMAGRNTPSTELNIAAAYVAARFRGAGLEGPGSDLSFFQSTSIEQVSPAKSGLSVNVDGTRIADCHVLMGLRDPVEISGAIENANSARADQKFAGPVWLSDSPLPPQVLSNPGGAVVAWSRKIREIAKQGATLVIVPIGSDSPLHEIARRLSETPITLPQQFAFACPVVIVPAGTELENKTVSVTVPANRIISTPVHNVIGILKGSDPELSKQAIIISAHLDHIGTRDGGEDTINNGADDNATGVTAVVSLADAYSKLSNRPKRTVIFMTFWGEEKGLLGSKYYAQNPIWPLDQTIANVNIEMIGRPEENAEGKAWGTGWTRSTLCDLVAAGAKRAEVDVFHREDVSEMLYARSDNYSFVNAGVIAHSFSAGSLHADYHQPSDEVSRLNLPHMTKIIRGLMAGTLPLATGEATPIATKN
ncbi:MAG: M28 family peptidase [Planctomyces sp.]|nr:M28 family peptidase [Planctomyces sp.]